MRPRPPSHTQTDTLFPYTTRFRSSVRSRSARSGATRWAARWGLLELGAGVILAQLWATLWAVACLFASARAQGAVGSAFCRIHGRKIGRAHVRTPVTNAHIVCRLLLEKKIITYQEPNECLRL